MRYGIANTTGQPDENAVEQIIGAVWDRGVRLFDTAQTYGRSEEILGQVFARLSISAAAAVIGKLDDECTSHSDILSAIQRSLNRLGVPQLWAILLHKEDLLDQWRESILPALLQAKREGQVVRVGVSVYSVKRALEALDLDEVDVIQVPANVFDRRMQQAGIFETAAKRGKTVMVRSLYLQGLALMEPNSAPSTIPGARVAVATLNQFCNENGIDRRHFAIGYVRQMAPEALFIIGAETKSQALENCLAFEKKAFPQEVNAAWTNRWSVEDEILVNPQHWPVNS